MQKYFLHVEFGKEPLDSDAESEEESDESQNKEGQDLIPIYT